MRKFKHPVSMYLTVRDIKDSDFIQSMDKLGYNVKPLNRIAFDNVSGRVFVYTNVKLNDVCYIIHGYEDKNHVSISNPNLFASIAAMRVGNKIFNGEILKKTNGGDFKCTFKSYNSDTTFICYEDNGIRDIKDFIKLTREEIVDYFKNKKPDYTPINGELVQWSHNGFHWDKGEYVGAIKNIGHVVSVKGKSIVECGLVTVKFIRPLITKKVTRAEIAKLLGVDEFEIID